MLTKEALEVFQHEGPVAIVTTSKEGAHLVATWLSYIQVVGDTTLIIPAYGYQQTQHNIQDGSQVQLLIGTKELTGTAGAGRGFRLTGRGRFESAGEIFQKTISRSPGARAALIITVDKVEQLI